MDQKCVNEEFVYPVTLKQLILRLLILGSRKNNYNTQLKNLTKEDRDYIKQEIQNGKGGEILDIVREVYAESRAPKQEVTMLMMALLCRAADVDLRLKSLAL